MSKDASWGEDTVVLQRDATQEPPRVKPRPAAWKPPLPSRRTLAELLCGLVVIALLASSGESGTPASSPAMPQREPRQAAKEKLGEPAPVQFLPPRRRDSQPSPPPPRSHRHRHRHRKPARPHRRVSSPESPPVPAAGEPEQVISEPAPESVPVPTPQPSPAPTSPGAEFGM
jgi:hypothetical protein